MGVGIVFFWRHISDASYVCDAYVLYVVGISDIRVGMGLNVEPGEPTVRDPASAQTEYRAKYVFDLDSKLGPWLVVVPLGAALGTYRVEMTVMGPTSA
jgi:hypothetical protein